MADAPGIDLTEETIFTWGAPPLKFGAGAVDEIGFEMAQFGARRVLILTDPRINELGIPARIAESLTKHGITSEIFDGCHVEPTDDSMDKAAGYAREQGPWDGFVAVGGGSSIDTAKAVNLLTTDEGSLMDYINKPIGGGRAPSRQLKPLIAVPTTAGTGSESTAMCVLDVLSMRVKTGISHWRLRPTLAVIDPLAVADHPAGGHRLGRDGHRVPRPGVLHRPLVHHVRPQAARAAGHLLRLQPGLRPVVREGARAARRLVPHRVPATGPTSRRGAT